MDSIVEIHEAVYEFLEGYRKQESMTGRSFYYTLRRSNAKERLNKGYWFYGNENYLVVSFWGGMDWKNKTPNIFFKITDEGRSSLTFTTRDSYKKAQICKAFLVTPLEMKSHGNETWIKEFKTVDYIQSLREFIGFEKVKIDRIIEQQELNFISEDESNAIGFIHENDFENWLSNVNKYRDDKGLIKIPISLTAFSVEKYEPIKSASINRISKNVPFIVLVGENGSGKSSLLKALATALGNNFFEKGLEPTNSPWIIKFSLSLQGIDHLFKITQYEPFVENNPNTPFACFGPSRLIIDSRIMRTNINELGKDRSAPLYGLFNPDGILKDINRWVINQVSFTNISVETKHNAKLLYENIKQMIISIVPNLYDIREYKDTKDLLYYEEDLKGEKIERGVIFEHLSSGLRSLIAMLGDMMLRLFDQQPEITDPSSLCGIVLIDEIDIHLHPNWQKKIPKILSDNFPKVQFIVTTHSPIPLLGLPKNSKVYNLSRIADKGVVIKSLNYLNISNLLPNTILTSPIFEMDDLVADSNINIAQVNVDDSIKDTEFFSLLDRKMVELSKNEEIFNQKYFNNETGNKKY